MEKTPYPCPFCGKTPRMDNGFSPAESIYYVWCINEDCFMSDIQDISIDQWNTTTMKLLWENK